ncbi:MAG: LuxR C-terminal-related transcriptional regulator [Bacteroidales bacterium]|nr:LuxR C-terminal-related transcriptional regulator [Bacteroidales bacterium]
MTTKSVAIILHNRLEALGMASLLNGHYEVDVHIVSAFEQLPVAQRERFGLFVTSEDEFLKHLSFFMPHNEATVIITDKLDSSHYTTLSPHTTEEEMLALLDPYFRDDCGEGNQNHLTQRETMVLRLVVEGLLNKEIADRLNISINTVLTHRKNITAKLGIKSVSGLSVYAIMNGIVSPK